MRELGEKLRAARTQRGWSVEDVARKTRIAEEHICAIESGQVERLPAGPYSTAWVRSYCDLVGLPEPKEEFATRGWKTPLWVVRAFGGISVVMVLGLIGILQWGPDFDGPAPPPEIKTPDQVVKIIPRKDVSVVVEVDGERVLDGPVPVGEAKEFVAFHKIEVRVPSVDSVRFIYNGRSIVPQGRQDVPRRLVFGTDGE